MNRTTLSLEPGLFRRLRQEAARQGKTLRECVNTYLRLGLDASRPGAAKRGAWRLPTYSLGAPKVDVSDREALDALDRQA